MNMEAGLTVSAMVVLAVTAPDVPVMVTVAAPTVAVALAVRVNTLVELVGLVPNVAVTPLGNPDAARVKLPVNPHAPSNDMVSVPLVPWAIDSAVAEGTSVKLAGAVMASSMVVVAVKKPEVPVMVIVEAPALQPIVLLAVSVSTLDPVAGLVPNVAVTPLGRPEAARVTLPLKPPTSVTVMVSVVLLP